MTYIVDLDAYELCLEMKISLTTFLKNVSAQTIHMIRFSISFKNIFMLMIITECK